MDLNNADIFRNAAAVLARNGWVQRNYGVPGTPRCIGGALSEGAGEAVGWGLGGDLTECQVALGSRIAGRQLDHGDAISALVDWNNAPGRTKEEAIAALVDLAFDEDLKAAALDTKVPLSDGLTQSTPGIPTSPAESPLIREGVLCG